MFANAFSFIIDTIFGLFTLTVLLRFYLQITGAPFKNPLSQSVVAMTNFAVIPLRRFIPGWAGLDLSTLVLAFLSEFLLQIGLRLINDFPFLVAGHFVWVALVGISLMELVKLSIYIFLYATIAQALISWISPYNPISSVLNALTRPVLSPIRKLLPTSSGFDFSPIIVFIVAQLLLMLLVNPLEMQFMRFF